VLLLNQGGGRVAALQLNGRMIFGVSQRITGNNAIADCDAVIFDLSEVVASRLPLH